jgi:DNA-binding response OmpR family regulator
LEWSPTEKKLSTEYRNPRGNRMARILVIDDEEPIRSIITRALASQGHELVEAEDGEKGIRLFDTHTFDLVITDLIMPGKEGIETIIELRAKFPDLKILVVSGGLTHGGRSLDKYGPLKDAEVLGANGSISKPFEILELIKAVENLLSRD